MIVDEYEKLLEWIDAKHGTARREEAQRRHNLLGGAEPAQVLAALKAIAEENEREPVVRRRAAPAPAQCTILGTARGKVIIPPHFRGAAYQSLPPELKEALKDDPQALDRAFLRC